MRLHRTQKTGILPIVFSLFMLFPMNIHAYTLLDAWEAARTQMAEYQSAQYRYNADKEKAQQGLAPLLPQISVNGIHQKQYQTNNMATQSNVTAAKTQGWNVEISQSLFDMRKFAEFKQGKIMAQQALTQWDNSDEELMVFVGKTYFNVLLAQEKLKAIRMTQKAYSEQLEQAQAMFHAGAATIVDTYEAQSGLEAAEAEAIIIEAELNLAQSQLADITRLDPEKLEIIEDQTLGSLTINNEITHWQTLARQYNNEWQYQKFAVKNAEQTVNIAQSDHYPTLNISGGYQNNHITNNNETAYMGNMQNYESRYRAKGKFITLNLRIPLFSGGYTASKRRESQFRYLEAVAQLRATEEQINRNIKEHFLGIQSNKRRMAAQTRLLKTNQAKLEATSLGKQVGVRNNIDVVQAQKDLADAQKGAAEAKYSYLESYLNLLKQSGTLRQNDTLENMNHLFTNNSI